MSPADHVHAGGLRGSNGSAATVSVTAMRGRPRPHDTACEHGKPDDATEMELGVLTAASLYAGGSITQAEFDRWIAHSQAAALNRRPDPSAGDYSGAGMGNLGDGDGTYHGDAHAGTHTGAPGGSPGGDGSGGHGDGGGGGSCGSSCGSSCGGGH